MENVSKIYLDMKLTSLL